MTRNEEALTTMVSSTIVEYYNAYAAQPVKKFQDKETAVRRTAAVLDEAGMVFDEHCQLIPAKLIFNDDKQHEIDSAHMVDEPAAAEEVLTEKEQEMVAAYNEAIPRRASGDRQPTLKGQKLSVVGGKDAANPFREGSKSHATFAMVQANPGKTYEELRDMGARMRTITHSTKQGWIRAL